MIYPLNCHPDLALLLGSSNVVHTVYGLTTEVKEMYCVWKLTISPLQLISCTSFQLYINAHI